ncbi:MAG: LytTR family transcriptional regulator [Clostridiales Family XIII bacterium]|jgi:DNA-binding LytR/AlgR family response regulator|nr:LytTR family transcriptional regulator [Clostridiales Family XIII bacterium]
MKIRIEIDEKADETEVTIRCREVDEQVQRLQRTIAAAHGGEGAARIRLQKGGKEYYLPPQDILFFESANGRTWAHTETEVFETRLRLYELEDMLPHSFLRVSKSAIIGTAKIYPIERNPVGPSVVQFRGTHKQISVSRQYYRLLQDKMDFGGTEHGKQAK